MTIYNSEIERFNFNFENLFFVKTNFYGYFIKLMEL